MSSDDIKSCFLTNEQSVEIKFIDKPKTHTGLIKRG